MTDSFPTSWHYLLTTLLEGSEVSVQPCTEDTVAFLTMLKDHQRLLYQIIRSNCPSPADWRDLEQEIVLQLWRSFPKYDPSYKMSTWVYRIAFNVTITEFRKAGTRNKQQPGTQDEYFFERLSAGGADPLAEERREQLYSAIRQLPSASRSVLLLHLDGHDYEAIADILGISPSNVGTKLSRIRIRLREKIIQK